MNFWKKFWKLVSHKHLLFGILLFALVIGMSFYETYHKVEVSFSDTEVVIQAKRYTMTVPYELISSVELLLLPDAGTVIDGRDDMTVRTGTWKNTQWGEYTICADLNAKNCIAIHLTDGRLFVFSSRSDMVTEEHYHILLSKLA